MGCRCTGMIFRIRIGKWRFTFSAAPVVDVVGVNSKLPDGNHILMWDFDDMKLEDIISWLRPIQWFCKLPRIFILNTGRPNSYIAYCFKRMNFISACSIIAMTPGVCKNFFKYGVYRGHFTLRVTPKEYRKIKLAAIMKSGYKEDAVIKELQSWTKYETISDTANTRRVEINVTRKNM